jgi:hypothetical protein
MPSLNAIAAHIVEKNPENCKNPLKWLSSRGITLPKIGR